MRLFDNKVIFVNTTYRCNVVCAKCMTRRSSKCGTSMSAGTRRILTEQLRTHDFKGCISMGTAEPLLDEGLPGFAEEVLNINKKVRFRILTNGLALDNLQKMPRDDRISYGITLDSMEQQPYLDYLQKGMDIERVKSLIRKWSERLAGSYLNFTVYKDNYLQIPDFCRFAVETGIKEVYLTEVRVFEGFEKALDGHIIEPSPELDDVIERAERYLSMNGIETSGIRLFQEHKHFACYLSEKAGPIIDTDGTVSLCRGREDVYVGNIHEADINERWLRFAEELDPAEWCSNCQYRTNSDGIHPLPSTIRR